MKADHKHSLFLLLIVLRLCNHTSGRPSEESVLQQQVFLLMDLMDVLHNLNNFENIIVYRTPSQLYEPPVENGLMLKWRNNQYENYDEGLDQSVVDIIANYVFSKKLHKPLMIFTIAPWNYVNDTEFIPNLGRILTNKNLAVVILNDIFNVELKEFVALSLGASLETKIVFLLIGHEMTNVHYFIRLEKLKRFFRWCWSKNILNVILLFQWVHIASSLIDLKLEVYTYTPFPNPIEIIQLTGQHPNDFFKDRISDVEGYEFKTPIYNDKPIVFKTIDSQTGNKIVTGIAGHLYMEYVKKINASFVEIPTVDNNSTILEHISELLLARNIDMAIHPYTALLPIDFFSSYPITNTNSCVVVPVFPEIYPGLYILLTLNQNMWLLLLIMFVGFQLAYSLLNYRDYGQWRLWESFSTTLQGILSMPLENITKNTSRALSSVALKRKLFVNMFLLLTGILYDQMFIAALSSFLSSTLYPQQIENLENLRSANISIMLLDYMFHTYNYLDLIPRNFTDYLEIADAETVSQHLNTLNTSYAYVVYNEEWKAMQGLQMNLWKPRFKIAPSLCIPNVYLTFPMQFNSPFYNSLKDFILSAQSAGLEVKWSDKVYLEIQRTSGVIASTIDTQEHPVALTLAHLSFAVYNYVVGIIVSITVFLWELKYGKSYYKTKKERRNN